MTLARAEGKVSSWKGVMEEVIYHEDDPEYNEHDKERKWRNFTKEETNPTPPNWNITVRKKNGVI